MEEDQKRMGRERQASGIVPDASVSGTTCFVGIGINGYQNWPSLQNAVRDVQAIADLLVSDYGFNKNQQRLLLNEEATEANIINLFEELANQVEPTDSLLIYYAGHGHLNQRGRGFWVPVDAPEGSVFRYIRNSTIKDYIGDINSLHTLLISDSCFSGSLFSSGTERASELVADELALLPSRWAICSGRHDEVVADGPSAGHSPFAESILDVLRNNTRPAITTAFLVNQVIDQTRSNYQQLPDGGPLQNVGHKRGQFVFRRQGKEGLNKQWQEIRAAADSEISEIRAKKKLIRQFITDYPNNDYLKAALALGLQMEQKKAMLDAWDSEFGLIAFISQDSPYREEAQARLQQIQKGEQASVVESLEKTVEASPDIKIKKEETAKGVTKRYTKDGDKTTKIPKKKMLVSTAEGSGSFSEIASTIKMNLVYLALAVLVVTFLFYFRILIDSLGYAIVYGRILPLFASFQSYRAGQKTVNYKAPLLVCIILFIGVIVIPFVLYGAALFEETDVFINILTTLVFCLPGFIVVYMLKKRLQKAT
jgi:hypothetical protein